MKTLLGMAREKKKEGVKPIASLNLNQNKLQQQQQQQQKQAYHDESEP